MRYCERYFIASGRLSLECGVGASDLDWKPPASEPFALFFLHSLARSLRSFSHTVWGEKLHTYISFSMRAKLCFHLNCEACI